MRLGHGLQCPTSPKHRAQCEGVRIQSQSHCHCPMNLCCANHVVYSEGTSGQSEGPIWGQQTPDWFITPRLPAHQGGLHTHGPGPRATVSLDPHQPAGLYWHQSKPLPRSPAIRGSPIPSLAVSQLELIGTQGPFLPALPSVTMFIPHVPAASPGRYFRSVLLHDELQDEAQHERS
jgi:hypothetical protein